MSLYDLAGGASPIQQMTRSFLEAAQADPLLGEMFAGLTGHDQHIASFFVAMFGGPDDYFQERGGVPFVLDQHLGLHIAEAQRQRWVHLMTDAAVSTGMSAKFVEGFAAYLQGPSRAVTNISNRTPAT